MSHDTKIQILTLLNDYWHLALGALLLLLMLSLMFTKPRYTMLLQNYVIDMVVVGAIAIVLIGFYQYVFAWVMAAIAVAGLMSHGTWAYRPSGVRQYLHNLDDYQEGRVEEPTKRR